MKRIGIFDSGVGGVIFAKKLKHAYPELQIKIIRDTKNGSYSEKTPRSIKKLTEYVIQPLLRADLVVIACNTATTHALDYLRLKQPGLTFIGFEPALKTAALRTKSGKIAVLATPSVIKSSRYLKLKQLYGKYMTIFEPSLPTLMKQIETSTVSWPKLEALLTNLINQKVDVIVSGCTHYDLIVPKIQRILGSNVTVLDSTQTAFNRLNTLLKHSGQVLPPTPEMVE